MKVNVEASESITTMMAHSDKIQCSSGIPPSRTFFKGCGWPCKIRDSRDHRREALQDEIRPGGLGGTRSTHRRNLDVIGVLKVHENEIENENELSHPDWVS